MKRSRIINLKATRVHEFFSKNRTVLLMCFIFAIGVAVGVLSLRHSKTAYEIAESSLKNYIADRQNESFFSVVLASASSSLFLMLTCFICGASLMGMILVPLLLCFLGFWYGTLSAFVYSSYALKGVAFNAIILIPPSLIFLICLLLASRESIGFSSLMARLTLPRTGAANLFIDFKNYCGRYVFLSVIIIISALLDAVLSCSFLKFFEF